MSEPLRILVITRNYPPLVGGIERVMQRAVSTFATLGEVAMVGPTGSEAHTPPGVRVATSKPSPMSRFLVGSAIDAVRVASRFRPNVVFSGSGLVAPIARAVGSLYGATTLGYVYGLDIVVESALYQRAWLPSIRALDALVAISEPTRAEAIQRGIAPDRIDVLHPGVDLRVGDGARFRARHGYGEKPLLLSLGRLNPRKGLVPFVENALPAIVTEVADVQFAIVGTDATDAGTHTESVTAGITRAAAARGLAPSVHLLGRLDDDEVADALAAADLFVFPVVRLAGDMEGFGMVAIEAAANGTPTLAFAVGGVVDAVVDGESGALIEPADYAAFAARAIAMLRDPAARPSAAACRAVAERYSWDRFDSTLRAWALDRVQRRHGA